MLEVVSVGMLRVGSLLWQPTSSTWALTVVCKATYTLCPVESPLADEQDPANEDDEHWNDDPLRSVRAPGDLVPAKRGAEVMLVGHAFAPGGAPARSLTARLVVGGVDKSIAVACDRAVLPDGTVQESGPFVRMPLMYERAAGGPGTRNPAGLRADARDAHGRRTLPNLEPPVVDGGSDAAEPAGFGPLAASWPARTEKLARGSSTLAPEQLRRGPLPEGFDFSFFNQAPRDQQVQALRDDERIVLENLHPKHSRLVTSLPGVRPAAFLERGGRADRLPLQPDTLWIDSDRGVATLTWRAQVQLESPDDAGRVVVGSEGPGQGMSWALLKRVANLAAAAGGVVPAPPGTTVAMPHGVSVPTGPALPFPASLGGARDLRLPANVGGGLPFLPRVPGATPRPAVLPPPLPPPPALPVPVPPPVIAARPAEKNEARVPRPAEAGRAAVSREFIQLVWFDRESAPRIRRPPRWRQVLDDLEQRPVDPASDPGPGKDPGEIDDRREVFEILARAEPMDARGAQQALVDAIQDDGKLVGPIVLVAGELELPFDQGEALREAVAAAAPLLSGGDNELREAVAAARELVQALPVAAGAAEALLARIREAFAREKKGLAPDYLAAQIDRALLAGRHYQKREVLGGTFLRCLLTTADGVLLVYLPADLAKKLPMFKRFRARLLGELHPAQDQAETHAEALAGLALARVGGVAPKV